jgi:aspartyl/glutamyl-tRNA(Asn/Gln) amidotransferase C subunit
MISEKQILELANLAKLSFKKDELPILINNMEDIINFTSRIANVNIKRNHCNCSESSIKLREDEIKDSFPKDEILNNAESKNGFFFV